MNKLIFPYESYANRIRMHIMGNRFHDTVVLTEGSLDTKFLTKMVKSSVHSRSMDGRDTVLAVCKILREENFPSYGVIDIDYFWYHSAEHPDPPNVYTLDHNNLESFVLFQGDISSKWSYSEPEDRLINVMACAKILGFLRCINHSKNKSWSFKENNRMSQSNCHLRTELLNSFLNTTDYNPDIFLDSVLTLYNLERTDFNRLSQEIEESLNYSLPRIVNGKDLDEFLTLSGIGTDIFRKLYSLYTPKMFRTTNLGRVFVEKGLLAD